MQIGFEEDPRLSGVPSHPQRRAYPRGDCCLGQRISSCQDKTQIWSFPAFRPHPLPAPRNVQPRLDLSQSRIPMSVITGLLFSPFPPSLDRKSVV